MNKNETAPRGKGQNATETENLEELLLRTAAGDKDAFTALYHESKTAMYYFLLSYVAPNDIEDVLQETYLAIFQSAGTYRPNGIPQSWMFGIGKNKARMKLRTLGRETVLPEEQWNCMTAEPSGLSVEDRLVLHGLLQHLSQEEYRIVVLHAAAGLRFREIAATLCLPLSTTLSKYHRAMKKMRKCMEGENGT